MSGARMSGAGTGGAQQTDAWSAYERTTSRWGRLTMLAGLVLSLAGPAWLAFGAGLDVELGRVIVAFSAIAATFGVIWIVEPLSYYPILGPASMYQAFMIGNISNKLLPAAIIAQTTIDAKAGTRRAELAAVLAIGGAAVVHLVSLFVFVGLLGTALVSIVPAPVIALVQAYVLPAILGAVIVQMVLANPQWRIIGIALAVAAIVVFVLTPLAPVVSFFAVALSVVVTIALSLSIPAVRRAATPTPTPDPDPAASNEGAPDA